MAEKFFVASCVFTEEYPELSKKIQKYIAEKNLPIIRCCVSNYKVEDFENRNAAGFFQEHSQQEKENLMREHCKKISTEKVVAYCHYCARGLRLGGKKTFHLAELLF